MTIFGKFGVLESIPMLYLMQSYQKSVVKLFLKKGVKILKKSAKLSKLGEKT